MEAARVGALSRYATTEISDARFAIAVAACR